ncbi:hypothetical protein HW115_11530 [Verrucomicrobiaceae bacterium N1E253]|uniref:Uncharacterized protein n=1 Tax=Oceaniferula marina TaxID=2748318 RepID=A0A851GQ16_9BACT|nr:hypothetical protein [Oceaniferula marina]NWK56244.1 hypothetical protein [Oceaniferula marina]
MKRRTILLISSLTLPLYGQVYNPGNGGGNTARPAANNNNGDTTIVHKKKESKSPYGNEVPFIDPTQETITLMGHTFNIGDNRALGGQFESYLADSPNTSKAAIEYRETIDAILDAVSPHTKGDIRSKLRNGFHMLPRAASYPGDGRICDSLSNAIYAAMLSKGSVQSSKEYIATLEKEKRRIARNFDISAAKIDLTDDQQSKGKPGQKKTGKQSTLAKAATSAQLQEIQKRILEIEALKKLHHAKDEVNIVQAKIQYQALLAQLFVQRRFEHVVIGTRFYNLIFRDGDSKMRLKKGSDVSKFFGEGLGVDPTVTGLDSAANEAIRKVNSLVTGFNNHLSHKELHSASKRLTEAFALGEFIPSVQTVPSDQRRQILEYVRDGNALVKAMDVHDYAAAKIYLEALKKRSTDFDSTKAEGAIAAYTRVSDGHIRAAKIALGQKDQAKFESELEKATQVWPTNPKLKEIDTLLDTFITKGDAANNTLNDYDRLLGDKNYRAIKDRYVEFAATIGQTNDATRTESLAEIMNSLKEVQEARSKAEFLAQKGQTYAAWEILEEARVKYYDDPLLQQQITSITAEVADFTRALARAEKFESNDLTPQTGSALSWYLEAKSIYPDSKFAQEGIDRLVNRVFEEDGNDSSIDEELSSN